MNDIKTVHELESTFAPSMIGDKYQISGAAGDTRYPTVAEVHSKGLGFGILFKIHDELQYLDDHILLRKL